MGNTTEAEQIMKRCQVGTRNYEETHISFARAIESKLKEVNT